MGEQREQEVGTKRVQRKTKRLNGSTTLTTLSNGRDRTKKTKTGRSRNREKTDTEKSGKKMRDGNDLAGEEEKDITAGKDAEGEARVTAAIEARVTAAKEAGTANLVEKEAEDKTAKTDVGRERRKP